MRKYLLILFIALSTNPCHSQEKGSSVIKSYYDSGKVKAIVYGKNYQKDKITYFDEDGDIVSERQYFNQGRNQTISFFKKGKLTSKYTHLGDKKEGEAIGFYDSGKVRWTGSYKNDLQNAEWYTYYENGLKYIFVFYENGRAMRDSLFDIEGRDSMIVDHEYSKSGIEKRIIYSDKMLKLTESYFKNDKLDGVTTSFYENGNKKFVGEYRKGKMFGERLYYNETGELCNGKFKDMNESGYVEREGVCVEGRPEGEFKVYNSKHSMAIKANFKNGKAEGLTYYYYGRDTISSIELYKNGKFVKEVKDDTK